ncbi:MAG: hypothetical protein R6U11_04115 [Bacteroidales bacterium]
MKFRMDLKQLSYYYQLSRNLHKGFSPIVWYEVPICIFIAFCVTGLYYGLTNAEFKVTIDKEKDSKDQNPK